tara:strand:+ start:107 stop:505 length:399 start_codon:yes stop_codon:yes gene_type:complete
MNDSKFQDILHKISIFSILSLFLTCITWEFLLAYFNSKSPWLIIKSIPIIFPILSTLKKNIYNLQLSSMFILLYFTEGVVRAWSETGYSLSFAILEIFFTILFFLSSIFYLRPFKREAKRKKLISEIDSNEK